MSARAWALIDRIIGLADAWRAGEITSAQLGELAAGIAIDATGGDSVSASSRPPLPEIVAGSPPVTREEIEYWARIFDLDADTLEGNVRAEEAAANGAPLHYQVGVVERGGEWHPAGAVDEYVASEAEAYEWIDRIRETTGADVSDHAIRATRVPS